jgi:hypothetical protein
MHSLSESNLIPSILVNNNFGFAPILITQGVACITLNTIGYFADSLYNNTNDPGFVYNLLQNIAFLSGSCACLADVVSFIILRVNYKFYERPFKSPYGIIGAVYASGIFVLNIICLAFFSYDLHSCIYAFLIIISLLSIYYHFIKDYQKLSKDEVSCLFKLHVASNNYNKKKNKRRRKTNVTMAKDIKTLHIFSNFDIHSVMKSSKSKNISTHSNNNSTHSNNISTHSNNISTRSIMKSPKSNNGRTQINIDTIQSNNDTMQSNNDTPQSNNDTPQSNNDTPQSNNDTPQSNNDTPQSNNDTHKGVSKTVSFS